jgi:hypothetical protein
VSEGVYHPESEPAVLIYALRCSTIATVVLTGSQKSLRSTDACYKDPTNSQMFDPAARPVPLIPPCSIHKGKVNAPGDD